MKLVMVNDKLVGQTLANAIYTENGIMFLNKGNKINQTVINRMKKMGITTIYIEDGNDDINLQEALPTPVKLHAIKLLKEVFDEAKKKRHIDDGKINTIVTDIMQNINLSENAALISNLVPNDDISKMVVHSIDVAILSIMIGLRKRFDQAKLTKLTASALLHDIGRLFKNDDTHVEVGYELIKSNSSFSPIVYMGVYNLYEREDGSGLHGTNRDSIHEVTKIISICNEYMKLITGEKAILPHQAVEKITADAVAKFDKEIFKDFMQSVYCYPNGMQVQLNNNLEGIVVMQNSGSTTRPILAVLDKDGYRFCNLIETNNLTLFIEKVII